MITVLHSQLWSRNQQGLRCVCARACVEGGGERENERDRETEMQPQVASSKAESSVAIEIQKYSRRTGPSSPDALPYLVRAGLCCQGLWSPEQKQVVRPSSVAALRGEGSGGMPCQRLPHQLGTKMQAELVQKTLSKPKSESCSLHLTGRMSPGKEFCRVRAEIASLRYISFFF